MQSSATTVEAYVEEAPPARRAALERLRDLCRRVFAEADEVVEYGMPAYRTAGVVRVSFASQKQYVALYGLGADVVERHRAHLTGVETGKSCIKFRKPDAIDFALVETMLTEARDGGRADPR